ncbi:ABC transporter permease [Ponticoccus sp. SC2-23]|uniref:ABC transporter permease n=1 Tax=Alexandriicola marinus TaxID=2081710 RepID=UPI0013DF5CCE|nr:ABC transporter permease [Alexandriicola marinus]MBM1221353.1 ABC transporter permease [Ponticoccus sp. SC6-9]MBM1226394.1 ABC transporter permease [Ponticoccus sp. SC6-15]MBM1230345.1 ABC transporter permease [Ponticoccus sp. SC6-38]MBM1234868.1 ABC transporter permease [Ponticoccus sp. SC6-45]MBM1239366.1 ABC transporter permease [Ponticoccus sp. SC6-49]MBM1243148.1 ABC transporter permease [Ponticoccus sp. SC2-64]MBM1248392.1 ABC transporter permease [Ponticoccus sp. SC6-42]MBM1252977
MTTSLQRTAPRKPRRLSLAEVAPALIVAALLVIGTVTSDRFMQSNNIFNILQYAAEPAIIAVGMMFVVLARGIDLSVGSVMGIGNVTVALLLAAGYPITVSIMAAIAFGGLIGLINGLLITKGRMEPIIATLATMIGARSVIYFMTDGAPLFSGIPRDFVTIVRGNALGVPNGVVFLLVAFAVAYVILRHTRYGRHIYAVGGSEETAELFGMKVTSIKISVYVISGMLAATAGVIGASRLGIGDPNSGIGYELVAITMIVVGGVRLAGGVGTVFGAFCGVLIVSILTNILQLNNVSTHAQHIFLGGGVIAMMLFLSSRERREH